jgi:hypothetical protein
MSKQLTWIFLNKFTGWIWSDKADERLKELLLSPESYEWFEVLFDIEKYYIKT